MDPRESDRQFMRNELRKIDRNIVIAMILVCTTLVLTFADCFLR